MVRARKPCFIAASRLRSVLVARLMLSPWLGYRFDRHLHRLCCSPQLWMVPCEFHLSREGTERQAVNSVSMQPEDGIAFWILAQVGET
jgi:hypothetical protein